METVYVGCVYYSNSSFNSDNIRIFVFYGSENFSYAKVIDSEDEVKSEFKGFEI